MKANDIKFRCSSLGNLMTTPKLKSEVLSEGAKTHLVDVFVSAVYGRREFIDGKALQKGNDREEDSITLLSRMEKKFFKKNDVRLSNDYIQGECDIFLGESIEKADETFDTKTSWSAHTFFRTIHKPLDKIYYWQGMGYMYLTGAKKHTVAYCLVNGTAQAIMDEKRKASYNFGIDPTSNPDFIEHCKQIEKNHIFDIDAFYEENPFFDFDNKIDIDPVNGIVSWDFDIPMEKRLFKFEVMRDEEAIKLIAEKVELGRVWMEKHLFND